MTPVVEYALNSGVATLTLANGKVNAISYQVIDELNAALDQAEQDEAVVVLTGQEGMFSGGYDLKVMNESMDVAMKLVEKGSRLARRMLAFPYPIIAACSGHAVAKGAFLLLAADYRIGVQGKFKIGLNEVAIGMTMHHAGVELARGRMAPSYFNRSVLLAEMVSPEGAIEFGFLDKVVPPAEFMPTVQGTAVMMTKLNMTAHRQTKLKVRAELLRILDDAIEQDIGSSL